MEYRKHQRQLLELLQKVVDQSVTTIITEITPGGGKSLLPQIAYTYLRQANRVDKVCAIVPRDNLKSQMAQDFQCPRQRQMVGHSYSIFEATNEVDPSRGTQGFVTTYQALGLDAAGINASEFERYRYLLVLDEIHHVVANGRWHRQIQPLIDRAAFTVIMTGTLQRGDNAPVAFLPYQESNYHALR